MDSGRKQIDRMTLGGRLNLDRISHLAHRLLLQPSGKQPPEQSGRFGTNPVDENFGRRRLPLQN